MRVKVIESAQNPTLKWIRKVCQDPRKEGLIVFEGEHTFEEALKSGFYFQAILMTETKLDKWKEHLSDFDVIVANDEIFSTVSLNKSPEGILVIGKMDRHILQKPADNSKYLYLDNVQDPVNVGILVRSAYAFSYDAVFVGKGSADPFNPGALARSAGAAFHIPVIDMSCENFGIWVKANGVSVIVADSSGADVSTYAGDEKPFVLVMGNEGKGVQEKIRGFANSFVSIRMRKNWDSLNVSAAGSILMQLMGNKAKCDTNHRFSGE
jgi:RNA methyltransferase, TrmH family